MFKQYRAIHKDVLDIYVGTDKGSIVRALDDPLPEGFDPRKRDWYTLALKQMKGAVISPVFQSVDGNPVVSISQLLPDGKGVISLNLDLSTLAKLIAAKKILFILLLSLVKNPKKNIRSHYLSQTMIS
ncbi:Methyl-accepting chemotaxis protein McpB [compost metagenome]